MKLYDKNTVVQLLEWAEFELISDSPLCTRGWLLYWILKGSQDYELVSEQFEELMAICTQLRDERRNAQDRKNWGYIIVNNPAMQEAIDFVQNSELDDASKSFEIKFITTGEYYSG